MFCNKCGNELEEDMSFCNKCGAKVSNVVSKESFKTNEIKYKVSDVVNKQSVLNSTNKVAYIANGWALKIKDRGIAIAVIIIVITFLVGAANSQYVNSGEAFLAIFGAGLLSAFIIVMSFNTTAFIIRMGAEVIQLLDDIKNGRKK